MQLIFKIGVPSADLFLYLHKGSSGHIMYMVKWY